MKTAHISTLLLALTAIASQPASADLRFFMPFVTVATGEAGEPGPIPGALPYTIMVPGAPGPSVAWASIGTQYYADLSGHNVAISMIDNPVLSPGGATFDGVDDAIKVELNVNPTAMPQMSWGAWVTPTNNSPIRQVLSHDDGGYDRSLGIDWRGGLSGEYSGFTGVGVLGDGTVATVDEKVFLAAVYDNATSSMSMWVNGQKTTATTSFGTGNDYFLIGANPCCGEHFAGSVTGIFVFDQALTDSQVNGIYTGGYSAVIALANPVPEPETYALMLAGLGLVGFAVRRKR
jgi:hypothetical protein